MWGSVGRHPAEPTGLFDHADSRSRRVATRLLESYQGYLLTRDSAGYNAIAASSDVIRLGCWAMPDASSWKHKKPMRRKTGKTDMAISLIGKLYATERQIQSLGSEETHQFQQHQSVPQLNKVWQWLDHTSYTNLPKGLLGEALPYLDKNWGKLTIYTQDGRLSIDNITAENAIRPFVVGRTNWLLCASVKGAKASANLYSLFETAKVNGLEPYLYLEQVFTV